MSGVAIITGSGRGIGAATAKLAARRGYAVCVNYLKNEARADAVVAEIRAGGGRAIMVQADTAIEDEVIKLFERVDLELGPVTALVNNAGITRRAGRLDSFDASAMRRVLDVNVTGAMLCAQQAVQRMSTKDGGAGGAIVNVSSLAANLGGAPISGFRMPPPKARSTASPSASRKRSRPRAYASTPSAPD
jgi:NAD(P)-dependent dehydrogenase (short-subunit alcohol dehydrogenase family)